MGTVYAEITLKNSADEDGFIEGRLNRQEVRSITVNAVVDTGAATIVINEEQRQKLGLAITEERIVKLADGGTALCKLTRPVDIYWKNRSWSCSAVVLPRGETVLLGVIPLEGMDLMVNPKTQELVGVHGEDIEYMAYCGSTEPRTQPQDQR